MLISNTLFRMGGAAILLSNKWKDSFKAKYRLECTVRVCKVNILFFFQRVFFNFSLF